MRKEVKARDQIWMRSSSGRRGKGWNVAIEAGVKLFDCAGGKRTQETGHALIVCLGDLPFMYNAEVIT